LSAREWDSHYLGTPAWDIGRPQPAIVRLAETGQVVGTVLDIGCNDGTLLLAYPKGVHRVGIDPSDAIEAIEGDVKVIRDIFPSPELVKEMGGKLFDIVTSIAMFYDLEDPVTFVRDVKKFLAPEGIWVFEMSYMPSMLRMNSYDTICHEHLEYYSLAVL